MPKQPITTSFVYPPIPIRRFDWVAYRDPEDKIYGSGETEAEAIEDLITQESYLLDDGDLENA